ncbi:MAG: reverse transcriptase/maturase family protein [candidate division KSB1 bacterium]|nr:reverse transcriptase/maturase family protein [candidate division KSB1 bacterium]MDZ7304943.1 reverse transcriptase/maturase family protein [candidate division KSB1 bacterium]MDZ7311661.1 reverse transcriptase/maturase family protein [candidate division KSB1 bacterium]
MKTHKNLYAQICSFENLLLAAKQAAAGKRFRPDVLEFFNDLEGNTLQLLRELRTQTYQPGSYESFYIYEPKKRMISKAPFRDRVVHHALINVIGPLFERRFIFDSYANRLGKGTHAAIRRLQQFMRQALYVLKIDLRQYFPSIDLEILKQLIRRVIADLETLWLIDKIIDSSNPQVETNWYFPGDDLFTPFERRRGLPIGNLTSQFFANVYLDPFDHFVKETLRCRFYLRFVDDAAFLDDSSQRLEALVPPMQNFLDDFRLKLYLEKCQIRPVACGQRFLGQIVFPRHRLLVPENVRRFARRMRQFQKRYARQKISLPQIRQSLMSWLGHAGQANTWALRQTLLPGVARFSRNTYFFDMSSCKNLPPYWARPS